MIDWESRKLLEKEYDRADDANNSGICPGCDEDHVLCLICGYCFKYCHPDDECQASDDYEYYA